VALVVRTVRLSTTNVSDGHVPWSDEMLPDTVAVWGGEGESPS
jgi:hypothetical protein